MESRVGEVENDKSCIRSRDHDARISIFPRTLVAMEVRTLLCLHSNGSVGHVGK